MSIKLVMNSSQKLKRKNGNSDQKNSEKFLTMRTTS